MDLIGLAEETRLFSQIAGGDETAFRIIFDRYRTGIFRFIFRMVKSELVAQELTQEVFVKLWAHREALAGITNPGGYIFIIARNKAINELDKIANDARLRKHLWHQLDEAQNSTEDQLDERESAGVIESALQELSTQKQRIFRLSRHQGLSHEEIARQLGLSRSTVKNNLVETLKWLRMRLKEHGGLVAVLLMLEEFYR
ncbi:MAG TPA: RNA polymerase sigma-70 factor [Puia sp.]|nr:RNA polymerase sigma-70 factor [Puia sp.]